MWKDTASVGMHWIQNETTTTFHFRPGGLFLLIAFLNHPKPSLFAQGESNPLLSGNARDTSCRWQHSLPDPLHKLAAKAEETPAATCSFCSERSLITYLRSSSYNIHCIDASMKNNEWLCAVSKRFNGGQNNRNVVSQGSISWPCNPSSAVLKTCTPWMPMAVSCFSSRSALISAWPCIVLAESFPTSANLETKQLMIWHFLMSKVVTWIMVQGDKLPAPKQALEATVPQCMEQHRRGWCEKPQQWRMPPSLLFSNVSLAIRNS